MSVSGSWSVTRSGVGHELRISPDGLALVGENAFEFMWDGIDGIDYPTTFSLELRALTGERVALGFVSRAELQEFRVAADAAVAEFAPHVAVSGNSRPAPSASSVRQRLAAELALSSLPAVVGRETLAEVGFICVNSVVSRNLLSDAGSDLKSGFGGRLTGMEKAIDTAIAEATQKIRLEAVDRGANAVVATSMEIASVSDKAQAILMSGTAVLLAELSTDES